MCLSHHDLMMMTKKDYEGENEVRIDYYVFIDVFMYACMCLLMYLYECINEFMHVCMYLCMYVFTYACI